MSTVGNPILRFCIENALKRAQGYRVLRDGEHLPEEFGSYAAYDGVDFLGGGCTRNLASTLDSYRDRLSIAKLGFFIWKPDDDGSVQRWMDQGVDDNLEDDDEEDCPYCRGSGKARGGCFT